MVYELIVENDAGRIWSRKPACASDGLVSVVRSGRARSARARKDGAGAARRFVLSAFSQGADVVAAVDTRGNITVFHVRKNRYSLLVRAGAAGTALAFVRRHELAAAFADLTVRIYDVHSGGLLGTLSGHRAPVRSLCVSPRGDTLVTTSPDAVLLWDLHDMARKRVLGSGPYGAVQAAYTAAGDTLVTAFRDGSFWFWDAESLALRKRLAPAYGGGSVCAAFALTADARHLVAVGASPLVHVWDVEGDALLHAFELPLPVTAASGLSILPDGTTAAVTCSDGAVRFVDVFACAVKHQLVSPDARRVCDQLAVDPRGNYGAAVSEDGVLRLYDLGVTRASAPAGVQLRRLLADGKGGAVEAGITADDLPAVPPTVSHGMGSPPASSLVDAAFPAGRKRKDWTGDGPGWKAPAAPAPATPPARPADADASGALGTLSHDRLKSLLDAYGEYPAKYRVLVWKFLLQLPGNTAAYEALSAKGAHPALDDLAQRYPLQNRALLSRLSRTLSALAHWAPIFGEAPTVPAMVFPLVKLFGADELAAFEATATMFTSVVPGWFGIFPDPPLAVVSAVEALLAWLDPELQNFLAACPGGVHAPAWTLLSTLFSDVLSKEEWMKVFDHVVTVGGSLLVCLAVAYLEYFREPIMSVSDPQHLEQLFTRNVALDVNRVLLLAYDVRQRAPSNLLPQDPPVRPLPKGHAYPVFEGYPRRAVDFAARERERLKAEEVALLRRRQVVAELTQRTDALAQMQAAWEAERGRLSALESARRQEVSAKEEELRVEKEKWEDREKEERLRQISVVENAYRASLQKQRATWQAELERLREELEKRRAALGSEVRRRLEDESLKALEFQAQQRLWALEEEQAHQAALDRVRQEVSIKEAVASLQEEKQAAEWSTEDEEMKLKRSHEAARRARVAAAREEAAARDAADELLLQKEMERDAKMTAVERERRLRRIAEVEAELSAAAVQAQRERDGAVAAAERAAVEANIAATRDKFAASSEQRKDVLASEQALAAREAEARAERAREVERAARRAQIEAQLAERRRELEAIDREEERQTQRALDKLAREKRLDGETEQELQLQASEIEARQAHLARVAEAETQVMLDERARFAQLREELANRAAQLHGEGRRRHEETLARLTVERERQLLELDSAWRKRAVREEIGALQSESKAHDEAAKEREGAYTAKESALLAEIEALRSQDPATYTPGGAAPAATAPAAGSDSPMSSSLSPSSGTASSYLSSPATGGGGDDGSGTGGDSGEPDTLAESSDPVGDVTLSSSVTDQHMTTPADITFSTTTPLRDSDSSN